MFEATLSIDLGASYTKVAFRRGCMPSQSGSKSEEALILVLDDSPLIPSIAIRTKSKTQPWLFGRQAAELKPDPSMKVFQNWKANLFRPENDTESASAVIVAEHFLEWLRERLEDAGVNLKKVQSRVALPAFKEFEEKALVVAQCMEMSGWESPLILKATEPHANMLGLFSKGRNIVGVTGAGTLTLNYGRMFGQENVLIQAARDHVLFGSRPNLVTSMVVDIGAFTTDMSCITFDVTAPDELSDGLQHIKQESHALGVINELDKPLFTALASAHNLDWSKISFFEREEVKRAVYDNGTFVLVGEKVGQVEVGQPADRDIVDAHITRFVDQLWERMSAFIDANDPKIVYLTGGGSLIPPVREGLEKHFRRRRRKIGRVDTGEPSQGRAKWRVWKSTGEGLHRLATALGGGSVVLQASMQPIHSGGNPPNAKPPVARRIDSRFVPCRCQGANKDCCFCAGRGFYARRES